MKTYDTVLTNEYVGKRTDETGWEHYLWTVTLVRHGVTQDKWTFPYRMGVGHVRSRCGKDWPTHGRYPMADQPCKHVQCFRIGPVAKEPDLYHVLTSIKGDCTYGATFAEWCADYGLNTDSRSAMDLYLACQESETKGAKFFGEAWSELLDDEDYS